MQRSEIEHLLPAVLLRTVAEGTAGAIGDEFLRCLVRHVALAFDAKFAFVAEATDPDGEHVRVLSGWFDGDWMDEPFEYDTRGKPCALVVERAVVAFPEALTTRFPEAQPAIDMGLESYLAVCLRAADGSHLGHMAVMDARPMEAGNDDVAAMREVAEVRRRGTMTGIDLGEHAADLRLGHRVTLEARKRGAIVRPLGDVVVLMPPLSISEDELRRLVAIVAESIEAAHASAYPPRPETRLARAA